MSFSGGQSTMILIRYTFLPRLFFLDMTMSPLSAFFSSFQPSSLWQISHASFQASSTIFKSSASLLIKNNRWKDRPRKDRSNRQFYGVDYFWRINQDRKNRENRENRHFPGYKVNVKWLKIDEVVLPKLTNWQLKSDRQKNRRNRRNRQSWKGWQNI